MADDGPGDRAEVALRSALQEGLAGGLFAGGVLALSRPDRIPVVVAGGSADRDLGLPCGPDTVFDLASLTKVVATTAVVAALVGEGRLAVDDAAARWVAGVDPRITLRHLLLHRAGLWEWQPLYRRTRSAAATVALAASLPLRYPPDSGFHYSDLSMILLGAAAERAGEAPLEELFARLVARPAGMTTAGFMPRGRAGSATWPAGCGPFAACGHGDDIEREMAATGEPYPVWLEGDFDDWRTGTVRGQASDGNAWWAMAGVSGHAGLFASALDVVRYGEALVGRGTAPLAPPPVLAEFLRPGPGPDAHALGFRVLGAGAGESTPPGGPAFWHGGFTGTRLLVQPDTGVVLVALTNRLHVLRSPGAPYPPDLTSWWGRLVATSLNAARP